MAIIDVPARLYFTDANLELIQAGAVMRSPFTGKRQVKKFPFDVWAFGGKLMTYDIYDAGPIKAFLAKLNGQVNSFRLKVPGYSKPTSGYLGTPTVSGAGQTGRILLCAAGVNSALILRAGDYFNIGDELKLVTADCFSNGAGLVNIPFEPPIRAIPINGLALTTINPFVLLASNDENPLDMNISPPIRHGFSIDAMEDI